MIVALCIEKEFIAIISVNLGRQRVALQKFILKITGLVNCYILFILWFQDNLWFASLDVFLLLEFVFYQIYNFLLMQKNLFLLNFFHINLILMQNYSLFLFLFAAENLEFPHSAAVIISSHFIQSHCISTSFKTLKFAQLIFQKRISYHWSFISAWRVSTCLRSESRAVSG